MEKGRKRKKWQKEQGKNGSRLSVGFFFEVFSEICFHYECKRERKKRKNEDEGEKRGRNGLR